MCEGGGRLVSSTFKNKNRKQKSNAAFNYNPRGAISEPRDPCCGNTEGFLMIYHFTVFIVTVCFLAVFFL